MKYVYIGKIVNTHGIKGEIRILSTFKYKEEVFKVNNNLIIDGKNYTIKTYRIHKNYDMVTLNNYNNINDVLFLKGKDVYVDRKTISMRLVDDLIGYEVIVNNTSKGIVTCTTKNKVQEILVVNNKYKILFIDEYILSIDDIKKQITVKEVGGIFDEN